MHTFASSPKALISKKIYSYFVWLSQPTPHPTPYENSGYAFLREQTAKNLLKHLTACEC